MVNKHEFLVERRNRRGRNKLEPHADLIEQLLQMGFSRADVVDYLAKFASLSVCRHTLARYLRRVAANRAPESASAPARERLASPEACTGLAATTVDTFVGEAL